MIPSLHKFVVAAALALGFVTGASASDTPPKLDGTQTVGADQVKELHAKGVPMFDARVAAEFAEKTIKGAINVPYKEKSAKEPGFDRTKDHFDVSKLPADKSAPLVLFCNGPECWKSYKAAVVTRDAGYKHIYWFRGGMPEWSAKGLPTQ
jgi:rhodanese-related sulfurtransferase